MKLDLEYIRNQFASLSDEALLEVDRSELVPAAQTCYDDELARRDLHSDDTGNSGGAGEPDAKEESQAALAGDSGEEPEWLGEAACACSFTAYPGKPKASEAESACEVLRAAGVPCHISMHEVDRPAADPPPRHEYRVMVPGALSLKASSVLDKEIFNPEAEAGWKTYFETLTDSELRALNPEILCAGLLDQVTRLKRAYAEEVARRRSN